MFSKDIKISFKTFLIDTYIKTGMEISKYGWFYKTNFTVKMERMESEFRLLYYFYIFTQNMHRVVLFANKFSQDT